MSSLRFRVQVCQEIAMIKAGTCLPSSEQGKCGESIPHAVSEQGASVSLLNGIGMYTWRAAEVRKEP